MGTKVIKTAGQVAHEDFQAAGAVVMPWKQTNQAAWEAFAKKHNIQPLTEEVPEPPTDGQLFEKAYYTRTDWPCAAAAFLRLRAERDGEPLPVTGEQLYHRWHLRCVNTDNGWDTLAEFINQHRGVRPVPVITSCVLSEGVLHTFEDADEMVAFTKSHDWGYAARLDGVEHHPRTDGGK